MELVTRFTQRYRGDVCPGRMLDERDLLDAFFLNHGVEVKHLFLCIIYYFLKNRI